MTHNDDETGNFDVITLRGTDADRGRESEATKMVSVVIPSFNQAHFLNEAVESVLSQTYRDFEVVVVNDGSTDNTPKVASRYEERVRLINQENRGRSSARNRGLAEAKGEYVVFLDADDRLLPEALEVGVRELEARPQCAFVSGHCRLIAADGSFSSTPPKSRIDGDHYRELLHYNYIWTPGAAMFRRATFGVVGVYDSSLEPCEDWDLYFRMARRFPTYHHGEVVVEYRQHDSNTTGHPALMLEATVAVLRSQRRYVKGNEEYEEAYRSGLRGGKAYYGDPLADEVRAHIQERRWGPALNDVLTLVRYYPQGITLLEERRMQRHKVARRLQSSQRELETRERKVREHRQGLRALGKVTDDADRRLKEELKNTLEKERREVQQLRGHVRRLELQVKKLDRRGGRIWGLLKGLVNGRGKAPR